tara:strand:- start:94 stop:303 length:210 start_codon:yes stop_codon:yes gene_type:complete
LAIVFKPFDFLKKLLERFLNEVNFLRTMSKSKHWKAYGTKHADKYEIKEIPCISTKFQHTKKIKVKKKE